MKVHLRQRKQTKSGSISLFLEIYKGTTTSSEGKVKNLRDYEYLNLYLIDKAKTPIDKQHNKDTLHLAESIKAKRELEIISKSLFLICGDPNLKQTYLDDGNDEIFYPIQGWM